MKKIIFFFVAIIFIAIIACNQTQQPTVVVPVSHDKEVHRGPLDATEAHLGEHMGHMQYYMLKLGLALQNKNVPLAKFYIQEVNEVAKELSEMNIIDEQFEISELVKSMLLPQVKKLTTDLDSNNTTNLTEQYKNVISNCNSCHTATKHAFLVVEEPSQPFNGQSFRPRQ